MRGDQLARQWRIQRHLESAQHGLTVAEISELEGIGARTAYRDLAALQEAGFPLYYERYDNANRWAFVDTYKFQVPQPFSLTELMSLHLYSDLIRAFKGTVFHDSLESLFKKVKATLPPPTLAYLDRVQSAFSVGLKPFKEYGRYPEIINSVNQAVTESRSVEIAYLPLCTDTETLRKVDPYKIWFFDGTIYLIGHCHLRGQVRMFVVDRIRMLRVTDDQFRYPRDFNLDEFLKHSFKVMQDELHTVKLIVSRDWSRWAGEKIWHESQKNRRLSDGRLEMTFQVAGLSEIKMWVLSLGPEVEVLEPPALRDLVRESLTRTLDQYRGRPAVPEKQMTPEQRNRKSGT